MELTLQQKAHLLGEGYVKVENLVERHLVDRALLAINHSIGQGMDPKNMESYRIRSFCPEIKDTPVITGLITQTPALSLLESATGKVEPIKYAQVALRFPIAAPGGEDSKPPHPHIDGMYHPHNGVKQGEILNFTALVGVLLSDLPATNAGNFTVWPGTHLAHAAYFRAHGPNVLLRGMPNLPLPEPVQITGRVGDVVIAHYLLGHGVAPNFSPHIRYMVFTRTHHVHFQRMKWESITDPWTTWDGMREVVPIQ